MLACLAWAQTPARPPRPEDAIVAKLRAAREDPTRSIELIVELIQQFPDSQSADSGGYSFATAFRKQAGLDPKPETLRRLATRFIEGTADAPAQLRVRMYTTAATAMVEQRSTADLAVALIQKTLPLLNEAAAIAFARKGNARDVAYARQIPNYKPRPFVPEEWAERYQTTEASYYSLLGRGYLMLNQTAEAETAFRKTYAIQPVAAAASGLAGILQKQGKDREALEFLTKAQLTGRLDREGVSEFHTLYARLNGGKLDGLERYLDDRYRASYRNPVKGAKYRAPAARSTRVALAEFITGAGCVPCIPFDYSFETALEDFTGSEFALLVYHMHAPTSDPLSNASSQARFKYYDVHGAPTVYLDGRRFESEDDDVRTIDGATKVAPRVYEALRSAIEKRLQTPAGATLKLEARREGERVSASATAALPEGGKRPATLYVVLAENEVHYSGENGLRTHLMVVRNVASQTGAGRFEHTFDVAAIAAQNEAYYPQYIAEMKARLGPDFSVSFHEEKSAIDAKNLSVVAFLQDDQSKEILQAAMVNLAAR
jgi:tetratricopeptide (TPR) repeat protein